ncbi:ABC1 kinase family protein [Saccharolobus shibatae]|uniref:ABC1 kinase family protein n=1 Tax=Saccharolobus shibatae TaxID=2286 RepID=UPI001C4842C6|nr:AarF/ABC1/UbiB kinase family protein [Saccharolobus shibatae]
MIKRLLKVFFKLTPRVLAYRAFRNRILKEMPIDEKEIAEEAKKFVDTLIELGPTFIKFGQILSVRPDIMPEAYIKELARLQDDVPPAPFNQVSKIIEEELGDSVKILKELSSASLGQVYLGEYKGKIVAIKVNRPRIKEIVNEDIQVVKKLLPLLRFVFDESFTEIIKVFLEEFSRRIFEEMDYTKEAFYLNKIKEELSDYPSLRIPSIVKATKRVLVMEYIKGYKVTSEEAKKIVGTRILAYRVFRLFMYMLLNKDYFHADPHPGNIAVDDQGNLVLYDFGMSGKIDEKTRNLLIRAYVAMIRMDADSLVRVLDELGAIQPFADRRVLAKGLKLFMQAMQGIEVSELELEDFMKLADQVFFKFPLRMPSKLVLPFRMINVLDGTCREIDKDFDFVKSSITFLEEEGYTTKVVIEQVREIVDGIWNRFRSFLLSYSQQQELINIQSSRRGSTIVNYIPQTILVITIIFYAITRDIIITLLMVILALSISLSGRKNT